MGRDKRQRQREGRQARREAEVATARRAARRRRAVTASVAAVVVVVGVVAVAALGGDDEEPGDTDTVSTTTTTSAATTSSTGDEPGSAQEGFAYGTGPCPPPEKPAEPVRSFDAAPMRCLEDGADYAATVRTSEGDITIDLLEGEAPGTVNNFVVLARFGYFDGDDFHRGVADFVIQAGDPVGEPPGTGDPGYTIPDELPAGGDAYVEGSVAMANSGPDSGGSQWFVYVGPNPLPGPNYSLFGRVGEGIDVVRSIEALAQPDQTLERPVAIESVEIVER